MLSLYRGYNIVDIIDIGVERSVLRILACFRLCLLNDLCFDMYLFLFCFKNFPHMKRNLYWLRTMLHAYLPRTYEYKLTGLFKM